MQIPSPTKRETKIGGNYALREHCVFVYREEGYNQQNNLHAITVSEGYNQQKHLQAGTVSCTILKPGSGP